MSQVAKHKFNSKPVLLFLILFLGLPQRTLYPAANVIPHQIVNLRKPILHEAAKVTMQEAQLIQDNEMPEIGSRSEATFRFNIPEFSKLEDSILSPTFYVWNLPWKILVKPCPSELPGQKWLGFFVQCFGDKDSTSWSIYVEAEMRLLSVQPQAETFARQMKHLFYAKENDWGFSRFIGWNDVLNVKKGFIKDDTITLEVHMNTEIFPSYGPKEQKIDKSNKMLKRQLDDTKEQISRNKAQKI